MITLIWFVILNDCYFMARSRPGGWGFQTSVKVVNNGRPLIYMGKGRLHSDKNGEVIRSDRNGEVT